MITLLTDFGTTDYFVATMKGVILSVEPDARIVDITHETPAYDIEAAAFTLLAAYSYFPIGTIHIAVVDPGVGSARRPILITSEKYTFIGPDNGLFSYICDREGSVSVLHLTNDLYFRYPLSSTFHGRDIFAPVAGALAGGVEPKMFGNEIEDYEKLRPLAPLVLDDGSIEARVLHIDRFGNCITNITPDELTDELIDRGCSLKVGETLIRSFRPFFSAANVTSNEVFGIWGSANFLEIAACRGSAAFLLGIERGQRVAVTIAK